MTAMCRGRKYSRLIIRLEGSEYEKDNYDITGYDIYSFRLRI